MIAPPEALLAGLDDQQRVAAEALIGPVCMLAGAGTGKTRAITHRIAYGVTTGAYAPSRVMALTFTSRAAAELRGRLRQLGAGGVAARTFHAAALSQLNYFWPHVVGGQAPRHPRRQGAACSATPPSPQAQARHRRPCATSPREIEWRKVSGLSIDEYAHPRHSAACPAGSTPSRSSTCSRRYEQLKDERRQIDFEDVLLRHGRHDRGGAIRRPCRCASSTASSSSTSTRTSRRCSTTCSPLARRPQRPLRRRRRQPDDLLLRRSAQRLPARLPEAASEDATVVRLEQNYRSTPAHRADREPAHARAAGRAHRCTPRSRESGGRGAEPRARTRATSRRPAASPSRSLELIEAGQPGRRTSRCSTG